MEVEPVRRMEDVRAMYQQLLVTATPREAECWLIGCNLALRAGDLLSLRWDQVQGDHVNIIEQKTGKRKQFPVTQVVRKALDRLADFYRSINFSPTYVFQSNANVNYHRDNPLRIQWLGVKLKEAAREIGLTVNINTHSMRKTYGYHAYENGADIYYLQALFNHANQKTTLRYIGITKTAIEKMYHDHGIEMT